METKIAILRGINVGGARKILMADLKSLLEALGYTEVSTYIQSGNVFFKASETAHQKLENAIEKAIKDQYGFDVPVIVRTAKELECAVESNPFYHEETDVNKLHLTFLKAQPEIENKKLTESYSYEPDQFEIIGNDVFIYCENKYHQSKLTNNFFEKKLKVGATTRNWKTVLKLIERSK